MLGQVKGPNNDPIGGTVGDTVSETISGSGTARLGSGTTQWQCQAVVPPVYVMVLPKHSLLGGGTARPGRWYRLR